MKIVKDAKVIDVSEKAFRVIFVNHGYTEYREDEKPGKKAKAKAGE